MVKAFKLLILNLVLILDYWTNLRLIATSGFPGKFSHSMLYFKLQYFDELYAYGIMHAFKPHVVYRCDDIKIVEMKYMHMIDACKFLNLYFEVLTI